MDVQHITHVAKAKQPLLCQVPCRSPREAPGQTLVVAVVGSCHGDSTPIAEGGLGRQASAI
jgi:hypothetical protein